MITRSLRTAVVCAAAAPLSRMLDLLLCLFVSQSGVSDGRSQRECEQQLPVFPKVSSHEACRTHPDRSEVPVLLETVARTSHCRLPLIIACVCGYHITLFTTQDGPSVKLSRLESSEVASTALLSTGTGTPATSRVRTASMSYTAHDPTTKPRRKLTRWEEITGSWRYVSVVDF